MVTTKRGRDDRQTEASLWRRLGWLVVLWGASVAALAVVAFLLRLVMQAAGLSAP